MSHDLVAIGASWGGLDAVRSVLGGLPAGLDAAVVIAQHRAPESHPTAFRDLLGAVTRLRVREAGDKDELRPGHAYVAPPDYHLLVERGTLALSTEEPVQYARPSIDVLFESAADEYGEHAIGIVLTGANDDGARGLARIKDCGGVAIVQDPSSSERRAMPDAAIAATAADAILPLDEIPKFLYGMCV